MKDPVVIIGCGKAKRELAPGQRVPIVELYTGSLFRARLTYAQALGGPHYVLSARHGLVPVDCEVETYEDDLNKRTARERRGWTELATVQIRSAATPKGQQEFEKRPIVALVAGRYAEWIGTLRREGHDVDVPAEGLPVGLAIRWLRNAAEVVRGEVAEDEPERVPDYDREADEVLAELEGVRPADDEEFVLSSGTLRALIAKVKAHRAFDGVRS